ncbi:MAG: TonB-dependent receptor [Desulfuromonadales bacterium]|nr:TonB-dependent receptor [Desulfuromonadales bacterium]
MNFICMAWLLTVFAFPAHADDFLDLGFEDLLEIQVISASKTPTRLMETAAAVSVINRADIHRSGARTVPEVLRMVPGVHVAQLDANRWAVTVRGFNGQTANKLLVMIDGRSIYTPTFSGTYWDALDVSLEEIERIEVVRGPGAALWGANAVNGVINIITSSALNNSTSQADVWLGTEERAGISLIHTIKQGEDSAVRLSAQGLIRDHGPLQGAGSAHDTQHGRLGLRWDLLGKKFALQTTASYYQKQQSSTYNQMNVIPPYNTLLIDKAELQGGHLRSRYSHYFSENSTLDVQFYYDYTSRHEWLYDQQIQQFNLDIQHSILLLGMHRLTWGANFDYSLDYYSSRQGQIDITPKHSRSHLLSFFAQDDYSLASDLTLTLGGKCEHNEVTGWEWQPNLRLLWQATPQLSLWGAVSRAVRTPSHVETNGALLTGIRPPTATIPLPQVTTLQGDHDIDAEDLLAWELGSRFAINNTLSFDLTLFLHDYDNLQGGTMQPPSVVFIDGQPVYLANFVANNNFDGHSYGAEVAVDWRVLPSWRLLLAYSYLDIQLRHSEATEVTMPELYTQHQISLQSRVDITRQLEADCWLTYNDGVIAQDISPRWDLQVRLGWHPDPIWLVELIGQNLLHDDKKELYSELSSVPSSRSERGVLLRVNYRF